MDIGRTEGAGGAGRIDAYPRISRVHVPAPTERAGPADRVTVSQQAQLVSEALGLPALRSERIDEVRQLLASGQLDTEARLEGALDRFLNEQRDLLQG